MGLVLLKKLWIQIMKLKNEKLVELIAQPSVGLFDLIKSGNVEGTKCLVGKSRAHVMTIKEPKTGQNLLHLLVLYRHFHSFISCLNRECGIEQLVGAVDNEGNNVQHMAAKNLPPQLQSSSGLRPNKKMQIELAWFKVNSFISLFFIITLCALPLYYFIYLLLIKKIWRNLDTFLLI